MKGSISTKGQMESNLSKDEDLGHSRQNATTTGDGKGGVNET